MKRLANFHSICLTELSSNTFCASKVEKNQAAPFTVYDFSVAKLLCHMHSERPTSFCMCMWPLRSVTDHLFFLFIFLFFYGRGLLQKLSDIGLKAIGPPFKEIYNGLVCDKKRPFNKTHIESRNRLFIYFKLDKTESQHKTRFEIKFRIKMYLFK